MVTVVCPWHTHHTRATQEIDRRLTHGEEMVIAAPALVEAYAVLTRLPPPYRLAPSDALTLLEANFMGTKIIALDGKSYRSLLLKAPDDKIAGGRIYDAIIAACALQAKVATLLTFNERHFLAFAEKGIAIVVP
jgi:predicted nucleic acid-binding protein